MTDQEINAAIAEACGWTNIGVRPNFGLSGGFYIGGDLAGVRSLPSYCTDLNAMHEAEKIMTIPQKQEYFYALNDAVGLVNPFSPAWILETTVVAISHATARQRAEAFIRTVCPDKWKE